MAQEAPMAPEVKENNKSKYPEPIIIDATEKHKATVIWIHGLGDTAKGWYDEMLAISKSLPYIRFILPTAPLRAITCNNGAVMNGWYDIESTQKREINKYEGKNDSAQYIHSLIANEIKSCNIASNQIIVAGFSQGGALSVYSGLLCQFKISAIICCSGYLLDFGIGNEQISKLNNGKTPIFMFHGKKDGVVPPEHAKKSYQHLKTNGCNIEWNEYNIPINNGHWVTAKEMNDVQNKIQSFLSK